jgi:hypothetical protein
MNAESTVRSGARAWGSRKTAGVVVDERILARHGRVVVRRREEMLVGKHTDKNIVAKHFDLLPNVTKESVAGPPANHHDGVNCNVSKIHGHRGARGANGMGANVFGFDAHFFFADHNHGSTEADSNIVAGGVTELPCQWVVHCVHRCLEACSWIG